MPARKPLPPHLEDLISRLERQDLIELDRAKAIREVQAAHPDAPRISWAAVLEAHAEFRERWEYVEELRNLALQDKSNSAGISGARSATTILRGTGRLGGEGGIGGRRQLTRDHRGLVEKHRGRW